ncbi:hypothetical protein BB559_007541 [Furculomyces boomerangus]|uniref:Uncharacterized protein n=2 Tax=Harpellales TaxID=61421 RepID=A0A2T9XWZ4_9FUNG|nr:hypothetical protein BB559_007541 [Furculomyces boomerangus]
MKSMLTPTKPINNERGFLVSGKSAVSPVRPINIFDSGFSSSQGLNALLKSNISANRKGFMNAETEQKTFNPVLMTPIGRKPETYYVQTGLNTSSRYMNTPKLPMSFYGLDGLGAPTPLHKQMFGGEFSPYKTARLPHPDSRSDIKGTRNQYIKSNFNYLSPEDVYKNFDLEELMPKYIEKTIQWFPKYLLQPLVNKINQVDTLLINNDMAHLTCENATLTSTSTLPSLTTTNSGIGGVSSRSTFGNINPTPLLTVGKPQNLVQLATSYGNLEGVKDRLSLEKYLSVSGYESSRKYIVHRIKTLVSSNFLKEYKWDSGGFHSDNKPWSSKSDPTDSTILFHLFCTFLDESIPLNFGGAKKTFTMKYVTNFEEKPDPSLPFQIVQVAKKPPHLCLVVNDTYYDAPTNYQNMFFTIALALLIIRNDHESYLETTNISGRHLGFTTIFD